MRFFKKKKENDAKLPKNELFDIPVGSMIELSDMATFNLDEETSKTYELKAYKKYESKGFLRYMYDMMDVDNEEIILGVDVDTATGECDIARFVIDSEEEFTEPLEDTIEMDFEDPESGDVVSVRYSRINIVNTAMKIISADDIEEHEDIELQDFSSDDGSILFAELWNDYFTFYIGELIEIENVNIFRINPDKKK